MGFFDCGIGNSTSACMETCPAVLRYLLQIGFSRLRTRQICLDGNSEVGQVARYFSVRFILTVKNLFH